MENLTFSPVSSPRTRSEKVIQNTYEHNRQSNYTEIIQALDRQFDYQKQRHLYWSIPEQSLLYGTQFYGECSADQKLALNHLYWVFAYTATAAAEMQTVMFNQVTADVFLALGGYETLYDELTLETEQEKAHIHAFQNINRKTTQALLGDRTFEKLLRRKDSGQANSHPLGPTVFRGLRTLSNVALKQYRSYQSEYLKSLQQRHKTLPAPTSGFGYMGAGLWSQSLLRFYIWNWGSSPFLASQYYNIRYMANGLLKNREHAIFRYFRRRKKSGEAIAYPTAVSHYHFLDESFHTTMSQFLGRDFYRELSPPTSYEKFLSNLSIYTVQSNSLTGLNAAIPGLYLGDDSYVIRFLYELLQLDLFGLTATEARQALEQSFCIEHEGLHVSSKWHTHLRNDYRNFFSHVPYLWQTNRTLSLMDRGASIDAVIRRNRQNFQSFMAQAA